MLREDIGIYTPAWEQGEGNYQIIRDGGISKEKKRNKEIKYRNQKKSSLKTIKKFQRSKSYCNYETGMSTI